MSLHKLRGSFFGIAADFANHDHRLGLGIAIEQVQRIHKIRPDDRIAADPNRSRLSNPPLRKLMHGFVSQRARPRNNPDRTFLVNRSRHDPDFAFARRNNSRTVRPDQPRAPVLQKLPRLHHVERRDALRDANDQVEFGVGRFHDRVRGKRRRHKNHGRVSARLVRSFAHRVENGPAFVRSSALARRDSTHNLRAVSRAGLGMKRAFAAS